MNIDSSSKVTWELVQSTVPNVEREWGVADEIVREFNELDAAQMELKLPQGIDSDFVEDLENAIERSESDVRSAACRRGVPRTSSRKTMSVRWRLPTWLESL